MFMPTLFTIFCEAHRRKDSHFLLHFLVLFFVMRHEIVPLDFIPTCVLEGALHGLVRQYETDVPGPAVNPSVPEILTFAR